MRRYRPDAVPVETRLLPASSRFTTVFDSLPGYSRWVPVVLNILNNRGHEPVQHGSSRISKVVHDGATVVTRFITVHPGSSNRGETGTLNRDSENGAKAVKWKEKIIHFCAGMHYLRYSPELLQFWWKAKWWSLLRTIAIHVAFIDYKAHLRQIQTIMPWPVSYMYMDCNIGH